MDLFSINEKKSSPLADRMRPKTLNDFLGQEHIVGKGRLLRRAIEADKLGSCIFFGPPGTGKSTLAQIIAHSTGSDFYSINAVTSGVKEVREIIDKARDAKRLFGKETFLLLDECHRWSKTQSDSILPAVENGTVKLIGSTTENPMVSMTSAIVSRCRVFEFHSLEEEDIIKALQRALTDKENGYGNMDIVLEEAAAKHIANVAGGDVRCALNALELAVLTTKPDSSGKITITLEIAEDSIQKRVIRMDDEEYYDMLSAFCKSLRGCDSTAALFWFARMVYAGVDPKVIVRRMIVHSSEDIGMANPTIINICVSAMHALEYIGMPEARINIAHAIIAVCESPKSNAVINAVDAAFSDAKRLSKADVPNHLRYSHVRGASQLKRGEGYKYPHEFQNHYVQQQYVPDELVGKEYYAPSNEGYEKKIREFRKYIKK